MVVGICQILDVIPIDAFCVFLLGTRQKNGATNTGGQRTRSAFVVIPSRVDSWGLGGSPVWVWRGSHCHALLVAGGVSSASVSGGVVEVIGVSMAIFRQKRYYAPFMGYKFIAYLCP